MAEVDDRAHVPMPPTSGADGTCRRCWSALPVDLARLYECLDEGAPRQGIPPGPGSVSKSAWPRSLSKRCGHALDMEADGILGDGPMARRATGALRRRRCRSRRSVADDGWHGGADTELYVASGRLQLAGVDTRRPDVDPAAGAVASLSGRSIASLREGPRLTVARASCVRPRRVAWLMGRPDRCRRGLVGCDPGRRRRPSRRATGVRPGAPGSRRPDDGRHAVRDRQRLEGAHGADRDEPRRGWRARLGHDGAVGARRRPPADRRPGHRRAAPRPPFGHR